MFVVAEGGGTCAETAETPWAVLDDTDDSTESCWASEEEATARAEELNAVDEGEEPSGGRFAAVLVIEGERTTDGREIAEGALSWRTLPLPIMLMTENSAGGHDGARIAGSIDSIERVNNELWATGAFDSGEDGQEARRLVEAQTLRWVSADIEASDYELIEEGDCSEEGWMAGDCKVVERVLDGRLIGATIVPFPAFPTAVIVPEGSPIEPATEDGRAAAAAIGVTPAVSVVASGGPSSPPAAWFSDPGLSAPTPLTITDEGRVFGHLATWGTCHTGISGTCTTAPRSAARYAYARTGEVVTADGTRVPVGHLTVGGGHADGRAGYRAAAAHYDDCGARVADVAFGEDEVGIWYAGSLVPTATDEQVRTLRASALSGDWRRIGGSLELVAALAVNAPGFPVPRSIAASGSMAESERPRATVVAGEQVSLVAATMVVADPVGDRFSRLEADIERLRATLEPLIPLAIERLSARVAAGG